MTSISSAQTSAQYGLQQSQNSTRSHGSVPTGELPPGLKANIAEIAESEGLSDEQAASLEADLQEALSGLFESGEGRPDPTTVKETISSVFEEYGLDAEALAGRLGPGGGRPPGGPPPGGPAGAGGPPPGGAPPEAGSSEESSETDEESLLTEQLKTLLEELKESDDSEAATKISELLISGLFGIDEEA